MTSTQIVKLAMLGGGGAGKSTLLIRYTQQVFVEEYDPTVHKLIFFINYKLEENFYKLELIGGDQAKLEILDIHIHDEFQAHVDKILSEQDAYLVCVALNQNQYLADAKQAMDYILRIKQKQPGQVPFVLVGTKCDLVPATVTSNDLAPLIQKYKATFVETSAKNNIRVAEAFQTAASLALAQKPKQLHAPENKSCTIQ